MFVKFLMCFLLIAASSSWRLDGSEIEPKSQVFLQKNGFCLCYDGRLKQACWVIEEFTADSLKGENDRKNFSFSEDSDIHLILRSTLKDYSGSGYDRGHLAPAANHVSSESAMKDSFLLSNMSPQAPEFNRGYWSKLEKYVRKLADQQDKVTVVTGPLFLPKQKKNGKKYITYEVIGANDVAVPTHYFKVICTSKGVEAYILPNKKIDAKIPLENFRASIDSVQKAAGILFQ